MMYYLFFIPGLAALICSWFVCFGGSTTARADNFLYDAPKPKVNSTSGLSYSAPDPAPRMMVAAEAMDAPRSGSSYLYPRPGYRRRTADRSREASASPRFPYNQSRDFLRTAAIEPIPAGDPAGPFREDLPPGVAIEGHTGRNYDGPNAGDPYGDYADGQYDDGPYGEGAYDDGSYGDDGNCKWCSTGMFASFHDWTKRSWFFGPQIWKNFNEYGGAQGFKGPIDQGTNGNFGFHKGVNWASPLWDAMGIGCQLGGTIAVSDFEGKNGPFNHTREQYFVTAGLFRRAACNGGLQGGVVVDYLSDQFYVHLNLLQIRSELSYIICCGHEFGVWAAAHTNSSTKSTSDGGPQSSTTYLGNNQYNLFYRRRFENGSIGRTWVGLTNEADVLFGSDATVPLSERWAIQAAYNYLLPSKSGDLPTVIKESFALSISLVWYPGYKTPNACYSPYRPLFTVADNGTFFETLRTSSN